MELRELWNNSLASDTPPSKEVDLSQLKARDSKHPLVVLMKHLKISLLLSYIVTALYLSLLFFIEDWLIRGALIIVVGFMLWVTIATQQFGKKIKAEIAADSSILSELKNVLAQFDRWLDFSSKAAIFIYPISVTAGFLFGGISAADISVAEFMSHTYVQWALAIAVAVLTPLSYFAAKWANQWAFGKHIKHLQDLIAQIEDSN